MVSRRKETRSQVNSRSDLAMDVRQVNVVGSEKSIHPARLISLAKIGIEQGARSLTIFVLKKLPSGGKLETGPSYGTS